MHEMNGVGRICIVANELKHLFRNGGIGTHNWLQAEALAAAGWSVHVLYCGDIEDIAQLDHCRRLWESKGIRLWHLAEFPSPAEDSVQCGLIGSIDQHSMLVRRAVEKLHAAHHFDLIEFAEYAGYGFRTIQARAMGTALADARIIIKLHSSSQWCRDGNRNWLAGSDDLICDYFERYSFEHADHQLSPSRYMLSYARGIGWNVRDDAQVIPYCYPESAPEVVRRDERIRELVFFGRLEQRKGIKLFLEIAESLPGEISLAFLGRESWVDGAPATQLIAEKLKPDGEHSEPNGRPFALHTDFHAEQALAYLCAPHRVAVMPSLVENYPFTVLECAANGIPFLASNAGGIPEIVGDSELQEALLFDPTPQALRLKIEKYLALDPATRGRYVERMHEICNSKLNHAKVCAAYAELLPRFSPISSSSPNDCPVQAPVRDEPLVSIAVPYYNLGALLPDTLASIAAQEYANTEVIVVNDGSTDPYAIEVWEQMQRKYPRFRFVTQDNQGLGAARNTGLALAQGEFFLPVDADNIARRDMVTQFVRALRRNPEISVATCFFLAFEETADIATGKFSYAYRPCGGPFVAAALRNVYGDANAMSRTAALRSVGGYETEKHTTCEDWEMYVKLVGRGHRIDVVPDYLFYYRHRPTSLLRTTDGFLNRRRVLRQFFESPSLSQAEQIELWTALASFDERQRQLQWALDRQVRINKQRHGVRLAVHNVKQALRKAPYYNNVSKKLKQLTGRAA
jgi:glycosyltransferase involved in cell wall biosynthesis